MLNRIGLRTFKAENFIGISLPESNCKFDICLTKSKAKQLKLKEGDISCTKEVQNYLAIVLKLHQVSYLRTNYLQVLSLIDVDFSKLVKDKKQHADDILQSLTNKGGLDYVPRERTPQGRVFEHAADSNLLIKHLLNLTDNDEKVSSLTDHLFTVSYDPNDKTSALLLEK